jgi:hypothetical protein
MNNSSLNSKIPFRIRIGVTGHRSLADEPAMTERIETILESRIIEAFSQETQRLLHKATDTPIAITIVSALAEGADRLVAKAVLRRPLARLEVVLPYGRDVYQKEFASPESREEFTELLGQAHHITVVDKTFIGIGDSVEGRRDGYLKAGEYLLGQIDMLIAIWDGLEARGKGGTAEIVRLAEEKNKPVIIISTTVPLDITLKNGGTLHAHHLAKLNRFNSCPIADYEMGKYVENEYDFLYSHPTAGTVPDPMKQTVKDCLIPYYTRASIIAKNNQDIYHRTGRTAYVLSTVAVSSMAVAVIFRESSILSLTGYLVELTALVTLFFKIHRARKAEVHKNWLECRALAESIRIAFYFVSCGIAPEPLSRQRDGLHVTEVGDWIEAAFSEIRNSLPELRLSTNMDTGKLSKYIRECWIELQFRHHREKAGITERKNRFLKRLGIGFFAAAIVVSGVHLIMSWLSMKGYFGGELLHLTEGILSVVAITLPAAGATTNGYRSLMEYSRLSHRSLAMAVNLKMLHNSSENVSNQAELEAFLKRAEDLMLMESQDWVRLMSFAELENLT